ncbi:AraC family transcriptional regulator [Thalassotalea sp. HSM 43]|uniref:helix-turn-helix domain-containing protein n=1 Tax=Thalassotalea sp. HSM 43 TaxID=2552945 RepID=UPI00108148F3|nr:AraC family transcriptional regulator [Thalassotalea sp. HSM 43]QBY03447.1 AraC family transcriptional regulator [Thalassotalea sp. HSM 43]
MNNDNASGLLLVGFDLVLTSECSQVLSQICDINVVSSMERLEALANELEPQAIVYVMDYTTTIHLHNIQFLKTNFPQSLLYIATTSVSIPLLHQAINIGVANVYMFPFSPNDELDFTDNLSSKTSIQCRTQSKKEDISSIRFNRDDPVSSLLDIVERDFVKGPSLQDLSDDIHLSPSRLCHMFKDYCGLTYSHYLLCRRLEEGERLLNDNKQSITTIAYSLGFANPSHFSRNFKEHFNLTPNAFAQGDRSVTLSNTYIRYQRLRAELLPADSYAIPERKPVKKHASF